MAIVRGDYPDRHGWLSSAVPPEAEAKDEQGEQSEKKKSRAGAGA